MFPSYPAGFRAKFFWLAAATCLLSAASASAGVTALKIQSGKGNYLSGGKTFYLTPADGSFTASVMQPNVVEIQFNGGTAFWTLDFRAPNNQPLTPGTYENAGPIYGDTARPGLAVSSPATLGSFTIKEIAYGANSSVVAFRAAFVAQFAGPQGLTAPLEGEVLYNASSEAPSHATAADALQAVAFVGREWQYQFGFTAPHGDVTVSGLPAGLQVNSAGLISGVPTSAGSYFTRFERTAADGIASAVLAINVKDPLSRTGGYTAIRTVDDPDEFLGEGRSDFLRSDYDPITYSGTPYRINIKCATPAAPNFEITITPPAGQQLTVGSYDNATPDAADKVPGSGLAMRVVANSRTCDSIGSFSISELEFDGSGNLSRIHMTFAIRCSNSDKTLRGEIWCNSLTAITSAREILGTVGQPLRYQIAANYQPTTYSADNLPSAFTIDTSTGEITGTPAAGGEYDFQIAAESATIRSTATIHLTVASSASVVNLSTRGAVGTGDNVLIGGFIVTGPTPKVLVLRGIAPSLALAGVPAILQDPKLTLTVQRSQAGYFNGVPSFTATANDDWQDSLGQFESRPRLEELGLEPQHAWESALHITAAAPGAYTVILSGVNGTTGGGLVEMYDVSPGSTSYLANISTRGFVGTADDVLIGGFIVAGPPNASCAIAIRGLGPSLAAAGVANALPDPVVNAYDLNGQRVAGNDDWQTDQAAEIRESGLKPDVATEAVLIHTFPVGNYTAILSGKNGATGVGLVEIYRF